MEDQDNERIVAILDSVADMTIATLRDDGYPQATTVSYVNDGLVIYFGTAANSQKAANLARDDKVSLTVNRPYHFWKDIVGLSISGRANAVSEAAEYRKAGRLLAERFPQVHVFADSGTEDIKLFRVDPEVISLLDYSIGFGHTVSFDLRADGQA